MSTEQVSAVPVGDDRKAERMILLQRSYAPTVTFVRSSFSVQMQVPKIHMCF